MPSVTNAKEARVKRRHERIADNMALEKLLKKRGSMADETALHKVRWTLTERICIWLGIRTSNSGRNTERSSSKDTHQHP